MIYDQPIETVPSAKLLGVTISEDLTWNLHIEKITKKASSRVYYLVMLKRCNAPISHLLKVYHSQIQSVLEYACQVWHPGLNKTQQSMIEDIQERCLKIIYSNNDYESNLKSAQIVTLHERRINLCTKLYRQIQNTSHRLHHLLPHERDPTYVMRNCTKYEPTKVRTERAKGSFINWSLYKLQ